MLTCKVGKTNVDTFTYEESRLREWSNKGMLRCPACEEKMLYCNGDFKIPYFRHEKNSNCPDLYSEGITQEHIQGIKILYDWLKNQEGVENLQLEKWIKDTRQRPDIYFTKEGQEYAIEFQCSPIATQYNKRHDLYKLQGIKDIWILGIDKYSIKEYDKILSLELLEYNIDDIRLKTIEIEINNSNTPLMYLNNTGNLIKSIDKAKSIYGYKTKYNNLIDSEKINKCHMKDLLNNGSLFDQNNPFIIISNIIKDKVNELNIRTYSDNYRFSTYIAGENVYMGISKYNHGYIYRTTTIDFVENKMNDIIESEIVKEEKIIEQNRIIKTERDMKEKKCNELTTRFKIVDKNCKFIYGQGNYNYYLWKVIFKCDEFDRTFFIKENQTDCTEHIGYYINLDTYKYREFNIDKIFEYISNNISNTLRNQKYGR